MRFQKYERFTLSSKRIDLIVSTLPFMMRFRLSTLKRWKTIELRQTHAPAFSTVHTKTRFQIDAFSI